MPPERQSLKLTIHNLKAKVALLDVKASRMKQLEQKCYDFEKRILVLERKLREK